jgi:hypothetical protein
LSTAPCPSTKALGFDRKIFPTLHHEEFGEGSHRNVIEDEDHFAVTDAMRDEYIGEFKVASGTGRCDTKSDKNGRWLGGRRQIRGAALGVLQRHVGAIRQLNRA